jgi:hypothetical protein
MALPASLTPTARRRRPATLLPFGLIVAIVAGCGGSASGSEGGGGGAGSASYDKVIAETQQAFGNTMTAGSVEGDTLKITLSDGAGAGMAKLFLCGNIRTFLKDAGLGSSKVVIVEQSGAQLATLDDC